MRNLFFAFRPIANDMASTLFLILLIALHVDAGVASLASMAFGAVHIAAMRATGRQIAPLQWASLALVVVFGAAGLVFHDIRFLMIKPTIVQLIIAAVMMRRGWMLRYMPPIAAGRGEGLMIAFGYVWAGFMASMAVANLVIAIWFTSAWVVYKATVPLAGSLILFAVHFLTVRHSVRRRMIAEAVPQAA